MLVDDDVEIISSLWAKKILHAKRAHFNLYLHALDEKGKTLFFFSIMNEFLKQFLSEHDKIDRDRQGDSYDFQNILVAH